MPSQSLALFVTVELVLLSSAAFAGSPMDSFFSPGKSAEYALQWEPTQDGSPSVLNQKLAGALPVSKTEKETWTLSGGASHFHLSQPVPIPQSAVVFPESLGRVEAGGSFLEKLGERRQWGTALSVGSASDHLFQSLRETEVSLTGSYMLPSRRQDAWLFLLNYSNNRNFLNNIPIPGVVYMWVPKRGLQIVAGFPMLVLQWRPEGAWSASLKVVGSTNQSAEIARRIYGPLRAYAAYQRSPEQWMRAGRDDFRNRLIYDEKKALAGVRAEFGGGVSLDLGGGRTFDRRLFEARDASRTGAPRANLSNGWMTTLQLSRRW